MAFEWTRTNTLALARQKCSHCHGLGLRSLSLDLPCYCVLRAIFRICYVRFIDYATTDRSMSKMSAELHHGTKNRGCWDRREEEYMADFILLARRNLTEFEFRLFRYRFLLGVDWRLCQRKLGIDKGDYFNHIYAIMHKLGRTFAELEPYPLYPLPEYFCTDRRSRGCTALHPVPARVTPIHPPLATPLVKDPADRPVRRVA